MTVALCRDVNIHISQELDIPRVIYSLPASFPLFSVRHNLMFVYHLSSVQALQQLREKALRRAKLNEDEVLQKIEERNSARKNKEYEKSDGIRKELAALGIALMDSPQGTSWRPAIPLELQEQLAT